MTINYAQSFERQIEQQFARELTSTNMELNKKYTFLNAQTIQVPTISLSGYKDHVRDGTKNRGAASSEYTPFRLMHDRDIEFFVDELDVDETNMALSAANITATFNEENAIPELDAYRYSKIYAQLDSLSGKVDTTVLTEENILGVFDELMKEMDEASVPQKGRVMAVTPAVYVMLKTAEKIQRALDVSAARDINRNVRSLDEVKIVMVPSDRMRSAYSFTEGFTPAAGSKQINLVLYHPLAIVAPVKIRDIFLWPKGSTPDSAFGYLYQNRLHTDLFVIPAKKAGVAINVTDDTAEPLPVLGFTIDKGTLAGTQIATVPTPPTGHAGYLVKVNGKLPNKGEELTDGDDGWAAYTLEDDIAILENNRIALVSVDSSDKVLAGGSKLVLAANIQD